MLDSRQSHDHLPAKPTTTTCEMTVFNHFRAKRLRRPSSATAALTLLVGLAACGGGADGEEDAADTADAPAAASRAADLPPHDPALAPQGEALFTAKGCGGCHAIGGGRLTGPDLAGVTERRERPWIMAMIMRPDSMVRDDQTARELLMQFATPMPNLNLTPEEAAALYAYLAREGATP